MSGGQMPPKSANVKNPEQYEALKDKKDVEAARGQDSQLARRVAARRPEVGQRRQLEAGRNDRRARGRRPQGRPGHGEDARTWGNR
jgi:hypothetical protein